MKHLIITLLAALTVLTAAAQNVDTTSTVVGEKLNFEEPTILPSTYFESVRMHLSAEGRKAWKPEFSFRGNVMIYVGSLELTGGIRTSPNKVFGLGVGRESVFHDAWPAHSYRFDFFLYHRHYIPLDKRRRFSLYSDIMGGGSYVYRVTDPPATFQDKLPVEVGDLRWFFSWQPGLSIRLVGKSNLFFGPCLGPSLGVHLGVAL